MKPILIALLALAVALAGCTNNNESTGDDGNGAGSEVSGELEVVGDDNSTVDGNGTTQETPTNANTTTSG